MNRDWEVDVKSMTYKEFLEKYNLKDIPAIRERYDELKGEESPKVVVMDEETMGECYELIENPTNVDVTSDKVRNYVFEGDEYSGWDTMEETLDIEFKTKPSKRFKTSRYC